MIRYEFKEHTADIIARAYGDTLEEAFAAAARAMFDIVTNGSEIKAVNKYEVKAESIDLEGLLVGFLSELIVLHETENVVLEQFQVVLDGDHGLTAVCLGEPFDPARHGGGSPVKGVAYHQMEIEKGDQGRPCHVQVLFDV
jgi:SHS2 domain-containing protein